MLPGVSLVALAALSFCVYLVYERRKLEALPWWQASHQGTHEIVLVASIDYAALRRSIETDPNADADRHTSICNVWKHEAFIHDDETRAVLKYWIFGDPPRFGKGGRAHDSRRFPKTHRSAPRDVN